MALPFYCPFEGYSLRNWIFCTVFCLCVWIYVFIRFTCVSFPHYCSQMCPIVTDYPWLFPPFKPQSVACSLPDCHVLCHTFHHLLRLSSWFDLFPCTPTSEFWFLLPFDFDLPCLDCLWLPDFLLLDLDLFVCRVGLPYCFRPSACDRCHSLDYPWYTCTLDLWPCFWTFDYTQDFLHCSDLPLIELCLLELWQRKYNFFLD